METITLSRKDQLVIPKAVRQSAQLSPGDVLSVRYVDGEIRLKPQKPLTAVLPTSLAEVAGCLASPARKPLDQAAAEAAIRARLKARFKVAGAAE